MSAMRILIHPLGLVLIAWVIWYFRIYRNEGVQVGEAVRVRIEEWERVNPR